MSPITTLRQEKVRAGDVLAQADASVVSSLGIATLVQVLAFYAAGGRDIADGPYRGDGRKNPNKDARLNQITLSTAEQADIIAFLKTLTDAEFLGNPRFSDLFNMDIQRNH